MQLPRVPARLPRQQLLDLGVGELAVRPVVGEGLRHSLGESLADALLAGQYLHQDGKSMVHSGVLAVQSAVECLDLGREGMQRLLHGSNTRRVAPGYPSDLTSR